MIYPLFSICLYINYSSCVSSVSMLELVNFQRVEEISVLNSQFPE